MNIFDRSPAVCADAWIAPNAAVIGDVLVGHQSSIWYGVVVRGDESSVQIGNGTNVQDNTVISTIRYSDEGLPTTAAIGSYVTIGHNCTLVSCIVEDFAKIGMGSVVNEGAIVGRGSVLGAGTVVPAGASIPALQLWVGNPAKFVRDLTEDDVKQFKKEATDYSKLSEKHADEFLPYGTAYLDAERVKSEGKSL